MYKGRNVFDCFRFHFLHTNYTHVCITLIFSLGGGAVFPLKRILIPYTGTASPWRSIGSSWVKIMLGVGRRAAQPEKKKTAAVVSDRFLNDNISSEKINVDGYLNFSTSIFFTFFQLHFRSLCVEYSVRICIISRKTYWLPINPELRLNGILHDLVSTISIGKSTGGHALSLQVRRLARSPVFGRETRSCPQTVFNVEIQNNNFSKSNHFIRRTCAIGVISFCEHFHKKKHE